MLHLPLYLVLSVKEKDLITGTPFSRILTISIGKIYLKSEKRKGMFLLQVILLNIGWLMSAFSVFPPFMWLRVQDTQRNSLKISKLALLPCIIMKWWSKRLWLEYIWDGSYCPSTNFYNSCPHLLSWRAVSLIRRHKGWFQIRIVTEPIYKMGHNFYM